MNETAQTATRLVLIGQGRLIANTTVTDFVAHASTSTVTVRTPDASRLRDQLLAPDVTITHPEPDVLQADGLTAQHIGTIAWQAHLPIYELTVQQA